MTKVTFKIEKPERKGERVTFAYFPKELWSPDGFRVSYANVGQHGPCDPEYARRCRLARYEEYKPLYDELVNVVGYDDLVVTNPDRKPARANPIPLGLG